MKQPDLFFRKSDDFLDGGEGDDLAGWLLDKANVCSWAVMFGGGIDNQV